MTNNTKTVPDVFKQHRHYKTYLEDQKEQKKERARKMLTYRYTTNPPRSYATIGKKFNVSRQRVAQIINSFL